ncbi:hypothetical protein TVWG_00010 [Tetraselmis viridis virus N1]|uniref:Uncharacterized protein n=1 Tax=Tetraselmis viridis virus S1 TaxID=756285 RepID=M4QPN0_9VIRU|nr:hypothetical protein TVSG_00013 [Tetraselmis viridis virus S1]AET84775.1 hypothetical protein TVWG_00010 [Tetraselmis viridis virus N1]AGH30813.1 hypothetical protein TVSG_00013 [Tetraselmis viridis virus S1]
MSGTPIDEKVIRERVKNIVAERGSGWIPDPVEETLYTNAVLTLLSFLDEAVNNVRVSFMGHELKMDLVKTNETCKYASDTGSSTQASTDEDYMKLRSGKLIKKRGVGRFFGRTGD